MKNRTRTEIYMSDKAIREQIATLGIVAAIGILAFIVTVASGGDFETPSGTISIIFLVLVAILMTPTGALFLFKLALDLNDTLRGRVYEEHH